MMKTVQSLRMPKKTSFKLEIVNKSPSPKKIKLPPPRAVKPQVLRTNRLVKKAKLLVHTTKFSENRIKENFSKSGKEKLRVEDRLQIKKQVLTEKKCNVYKNVNFVKTKQFVVCSKNFHQLLLGTN